MGNKYLDGTALTLVIIGAINWLLIGIFRFDLVAFLFGDMQSSVSADYTLSASTCTWAAKTKCLKKRKPQQIMLGLPFMSRLFDIL